MFVFSLGMKMDIKTCFQSFSNLPPGQMAQLVGGQFSPGI